MPRPKDHTDPERPTQEAIARRAYELFLQRGSVPGYELDDWLNAETELAAAAARPDPETEETSEPAPGRAGQRRTATRERSAGRRILRT